MSLVSHVQQNSKNDPTQHPTEQNILLSNNDKETTPNLPTSDVEASNTDIEERRSEPDMAEILSDNIWIYFSLKPRILSMTQLDFRNAFSRRFQEHHYNQLPQGHLTKCSNE